MLLPAAAPPVEEPPDEVAPLDEPPAGAPPVAVPPDEGAPDVVPPLAVVPPVLLTPAFPSTPPELVAPPAPVPSSDDEQPELNNPKKSRDAGKQGSRASIFISSRTFLLMRSVPQTNARE
jgi:hypothetical protein